MTAANFLPAASGIDRHGFVAEHGLHTAEQQSAAAEVAEHIDRLGITTVRVVVVDQHGTPRAKFLSPHAASAALSNGVDFSGAIHSMDSKNSIHPPAFAPGGGLGIEELTGFPFQAQDDVLPETGLGYLAGHLLDALAELDKDPLYREQFGPEFVDSCLMMERAEYARFESARDGAEDPDTAAAEWQLREYFEFS
jgi:glutamine synthetase